MQLKRIIFFTIALALLSYGIFNEEYKAVFTKAATICLECIGIG